MEMNIIAESSDQTKLYKNSLPNISILFDQPNNIDMHYAKFWCLSPPEKQLSCSELLIDLKYHRAVGNLWFAEQFVQLLNLNIFDFNEPIPKNIFFPSTLLSKDRLLQIPTIRLKSNFKYELTVVDSISPNSELGYLTYNMPF